MNSLLRKSVSLGLCLSALSTSACAQQNAAAPAKLNIAEKKATSSFLWWEAEDAARTNFPAPERNAFAPANEIEAAVLSGGKWVGTETDRNETLFLEYEVSVPETGKYQFYARKFWQHGPFRWRFDNGPWKEVRNTALLDEGPIRQFVVANWIHAGETELSAGKHTLRIELLENKGAASFDAFVLTTGSFTPRGKMKPGEKWNRAPEGWFPFEPDADTFKASPIDMRVLNEKFAGEGGYIQARDGQLVHSKTGTPIRFWGVNTGMDTASLDRASVDLMARSLAKQGVNMIRMHGGVWGSNWREVDQDKLNEIFYFVSAMKREGIYTCLSIYFPLWLRPQGNELEGYNGQKHPFASLFFNPEFQNVYRGWWKALLTTKNPHTDLTLADDPAVAVLEMVNEDSYLFWTFTYENVPAPQMEMLEGRFGDWMIKKYGSVQAALTKWNQGHARDRAVEGRVGFIPLWEIFNQRSLRGQDTAQFLTEDQKLFFEQTQKYLKDELKFKSLIYASNWITADARVLGPLDKYSNTVADIMDRHGYFGGQHEGERASYSVSKGDKYNDRSALLFTKADGKGEDYNLPIMDMHYNGMPSTITEINWAPPNRYRADLMLVSAAYGALQGTDGFYFFATASPSWESGISKFSLRTPVVMGQSPATAFMYRKGLITAGPRVVDVNLSIQDMFALKGAPVSAPLNLDELRAKDIPAGQTTAQVENVSKLDPLAFLVGQVNLNFTQNNAPSKIADLSKYIDRQNSVVRSATGELSWDYGNGVVTVNAPQVQAVTGFMNYGRATQLKDVTINSPLHYGAVTLVALDNKPIATSGKMLLQVMSEDNNYGWEAPGEGLREIKNLGAAPLVVKKLEGTVTLKRADASTLKVTPLDFNGYPQAPLAKGKSISLKSDVLYYLIEK